MPRFRESRTIASNGYDCHTGVNGADACVYAYARACARIGAGMKTESERGAISLPPDICDSRAVKRLKSGQGVSEYL